MEYIYSALILHSLGKEITEEGIKNILDAAGAEVDATRVKALVASLEGVNIEEAIATAVAVPAGVPAAPGAAPAGEEKKKEEEEKAEEEKEKKKKEEEKAEEEAAAGLGALFG
jgi:large subunit ribosomal protein L12